MNTVEDQYNALVAALNESDYTKNESLLILKEYNSFITNILNTDQRSEIAEVTAVFIKRVESYDWKFAHGFYGNWAKSASEKKGEDIDASDVNEVGC